MRDPIATGTTPSPKLDGVSSRRFVSVRARVALLVLVPLLGLGVVFGFFWTSTEQVKSDLERSRADLHRSVQAKALADALIAVELAMSDLSARPSEAGRTRLVDARSVAERRLADVEPKDADLAAGAAAVSADIDDALAAQERVGRNDASGLAAAAGATGDGLGRVIHDVVGIGDPNVVSLVDGFDRARRAQDKVLAGQDAAARTQFQAAADGMRRAIGASALSEDKKTDLVSGLDAYAGAFSAWSTGIDASVGAQSRARIALRAMADTADASALSASDAAEDANGRLARSQDRARMMVAAVLAAVALLCLAAGLVIGRGISVPIVRLAAVIRRMAAGDLSAQPDASSCADEIGALTAAVLALRQTALDKQRLDTEADETRRALERDCARRESETLAQAQADVEEVATLGAGLRKLSQGDLQVRIGSPFRPRSEPLRLDFNATVHQLKSAIESVGQVARGIRLRSGEIEQATQTLSGCIEVETTQLKETAASVNAITFTVKQVAADADRTHRAVEVARTGAAASGAVVRQATEAMTGIEDSSRQIGQIIGVIEQIAFQTNLLALNAGVEAARAGDAGRGFAVVAAEVRALAQRSADAARDIKALVSTSSAQVEQGVARVAETGVALERIVLEVSGLSSAVAAIAAAAREQASALQQINEGLARMEQTTRQNTVVAAETTTTALMLATDSRCLSEAVDHFDTGQPRDRFDQVRAALRRATPKPAGGVLIPMRHKASRPSLKVIGDPD